MYGSWTWIEEQVRIHSCERFSRRGYNLLTHCHQENLLKSLVQSSFDYLGALSATQAGYCAQCSAKDSACFTNTAAYNLVGIVKGNT